MIHRTLTAALAVAVTLVACGGEQEPTPAPPPAKADAVAVTAAAIAADTTAAAIAVPDTTPATVTAADTVAAATATDTTASSLAAPDTTAVTDTVAPSIPDTMAAAPDKPPSVKQPVKPTSAKRRADGKPCSRNADCRSGACEGQGCGPDEGRCVSRDRRCTRDLRTYCGCDGQTFHGSGTCPGRRFAHRGMCTSAAPGARACTVNSDCTVHFRTRTCSYMHPIAINKGFRRDARKLFPSPMKGVPVACAPPSFEEEEQAKARWGAVCKAKQCELMDRGPKRRPH